MISALQQHWKTYLMEAGCLGCFMISAAFFGTVLEFPGSTLRSSLPDPFIRRCLMGLAMGVTAIAIIYSPMGKKSGAHMNPALTVAFLTLGKISRIDAFFYVLFQLAGGLSAVVLMVWILGDSFSDKHVNYIITAPGMWGAGAAFAAESLISFIMMAVVLVTSNHRRLSGYTGLIAGGLVAVYVVLTANISGFSMNPARTLATAIPSGMFPSLWIYLTAPLLGTLVASMLYMRFHGVAWCAKLEHDLGYACIFNCGYRCTTTIANEEIEDYKKR